MFLHCPPGHATVSSSQACLLSRRGPRLFIQQEPALTSVVEKHLQLLRAANANQCAYYAAVAHA
jgi:hypothetical protein